jgi:uncharacterized CHY-type Zn-finger protein
MYLAIYETMGGHFVICARCSNRFSVPYEIGLWSCPVCRAANESAATVADKRVTSPAAQVRRKPLPMQLGEAWGRLTGRKSLYGYADRLIDVACPKCQAGITMTNNVRTARCVNCEAVVQRT